MVLFIYVACLIPTDVFDYYFFFFFFFQFSLFFRVIIYMMQNVLGGFYELRFIYIYDNKRFYLTIVVIVFLLVALVIIGMFIENVVGSLRKVV